MSIKLASARKLAYEILIGIQGYRNTPALPWDHVVGQPFWRTICYHLVKLSNSIPVSKTQDVCPTGRWGHMYKDVLFSAVMTDGGNWVSIPGRADRKGVVAPCHVASLNR